MKKEQIYWKNLLVMLITAIITTIVALAMLVVVLIDAAGIDIYADELNIDERVEVGTPIEELNLVEPCEVIEEIPEVEECATEIDIQEEVAEVVEEVDEKASLAYFNVPLSNDLQEHIFSLCEESNIDPAIVIAMIEAESIYTADIIGDNGNAFGLMQIHPRWHQERMDSLGCSNLLDPYQNVTVGIDILAELYELDRPTEWVLMAYNGGYAYANEYLANGEISH